MFHYSWCWMEQTADGISLWTGCYGKILLYVMTFLYSFKTHNCAFTVTQNEGYLFSRPPWSRMLGQQVQILGSKTLFRQKNKSFWMRVCMYIDSTTRIMLCVPTSMVRVIFLSRQFFLILPIYLDNGWGGFQMTHFHTGLKQTLMDSHLWAIT